MQTASGGGIANLILFNDCILGRNLHAGLKFPAANHTDDILADLMVFRDFVIIFIHNNPYYDLVH